MAALQAWVVAWLCLVALGVESSNLYFQQWWSHSQTAVAVTASRGVPWTVLVAGSSQVLAGIIPGEVERGILDSGGGPETVFALGLLAAVAPGELWAYREVRRGHHPKAVVVALSPRDLNARDFRDKLRVAVESTASARDVWPVVGYDPFHRLLLPWYVFCRDLGTPLQALDGWSAGYRAEVRAARELRGSAWEPPGHPVAGAKPYRSIPRDELIRIMRQESRGYETADFPAATKRLLEEIRADGARPFLLVLPLSAWGREHLPGRPEDVFAAELAEIREQTGVPVVAALQIAPELESESFYVDSIEHLTAEGASHLSLALGRALGSGIEQGR